MGNLNKVFLMGNLTRDPEVRYTPNGSSVVEFGMAINRSYNRQDGTKVEDTCFVDVSMFGKRGMVISQYFKKGSPILIEGRLNYRQWQDQNGQRRSKLNVVADNFEFLGGRGSGSGGGGGDSRGYSQGGSGQQSQGRPMPNQPHDDEPPLEDPGDSFNEQDVTGDDIPF